MQRLQRLVAQLRPASSHSANSVATIHPAAAASSSSSSSKPPTPTLSTFPYILPHSVHFGDVDMYSHVNNVVYYGYFDTVINTYLIKVGGMDPTGSIIGVCAGSECKYLASINFPSPTRFGLRVVHLGNSSVKYEVGIFRPAGTSHSAGMDIEATSNNDSDWQLAAIGTFVHVFVRREGPGGQVMKPTAIPDVIRKALKAIEAK